MIWVEILSRQHEVISRQRIDETTANVTIRVGRAFDNDVVIDDAYIAPCHMVLARDPSTGWTVQDNGTVNGVFIENRGRNRKLASEPVTIADDSIIRIGKTFLRIRRIDLAVAAERALPVPVRHAWRWPVLFAVAAITIEMLSAWFGETGESKLSRYILTIITMLATTLIWSTAWSLVSRIFSGQAQFERHLFIALSGLLAMSALDEMIGASAFAFSSQWLVENQFIFNWLIAAITLFFHLRLIGPAHLALKAASVLLISSLAIATTMVGKSEAKSSGQANYLRQLKPPMMRLIPAQTETAFFADAEKLKAKLDTARKEEKPDGGVFNFDFDD